MQNRPPPPAPDERPPVPAFTPVPRLTPRHDGWTPERQRAFIEALAETGSVTVAARAVNMAHASAYALRHHPQGASFARAWEAALGCGVQRLRDEAFDRALNGQLVPIIAAGKLIGYRRVKSDRLLMYLLRPHGERLADHFARPAATAAPDRPAAPAVPDRLALPAPAEAAAALADFAGVQLDEDTQAQMLALLQACAARQAALSPEDDSAIPFIHEIEANGDRAGTFEPTADPVTEFVPMHEGENAWETLHEPDRSAEIAAAVAAVAAARARPSQEKTLAELNAEAGEEVKAQDKARRAAARAAARARARR